MSIVSKPSKVYKSTKINNASFGNFNLTDYQVFLHLISKIGGVTKLGKYLQPEELEKKYTLTSHEFSEIFSVSRQHCYTLLRKAVGKLIKTDIKVERLDLNEVWHINICSVAKYNKSKGSINVEFTSHIMPYLAQVKEKFLLYNLKEIASFQSLYSTRLFELIKEFKTTGWMKKSVPQLRESFAVGSKFKVYADFRKRTFVPACKEINKIYNLDLRFEEIREKRRVVAIKFFFKKTKVKEITDKLGNIRSIFKKPALNKMELKQKTEAKALVDQPILLDNQIELKVKYPEKPKDKTLLSTILEFFGKK